MFFGRFRRRQTLAALAVMLLPGAASAASPALPAPPGLSATAAPPALQLSPADLAEIARGWDVRETVLDVEVKDDRDELIGLVDAVFFVPRTGASYAVIDVSDYVGREGHIIAFPLGRLSRAGDVFRLHGVTRDLVKSLPPFVYPD